MNEPKSGDDFIIISHDIINQILRTVSFPGKFDNLAIPVTGIDLEPDKTKTYYKYGKTTGVTSAKIYLMLQQPQVKEILSECKITLGRNNIYQIPDYSDNTLLAIYLPFDGKYESILNKDFFIGP